MDIMQRIATLTVPNGDGGTRNMYVSVWNNQIERSGEGQQYQYPRPAAFIEIANDVEYIYTGIEMKSAELQLNVHVEHEYYDAQDGTMEQNLAIFDLRDRIVMLLAGYEPVACSALVHLSETFDYDHTNIYHLVLGFVCNFVDSKSSAYDPDAGKIIIKDSITNLTVDYNIVNNLPPNPQVIKTFQIRK